MGEIIPHKVFAAGYFASKNLINVKVKKILTGTEENPETEVA